MAKKRGKRSGPKRIAYGRICVSLGRGQRAFLEEKAKKNVVPIAHLVRDAVTALIEKEQGAS